MSASPRLPHAASRWLAPRLALALAFAAGSAAVASLFLMRDMPGWIVPGCAAAAGLYGGIALLTRSRVTLALALATAAPITLAGFAIVLHWVFHKEQIWSAVVLASLVLGLVFAVLFGVPVRFALRARSVRAHDSADRVFVTTALWLTLVAGVASAAGALAGREEGKFFGHGGLTWLAQGLALALGAGLAGAALARDLGRRRFLRDVGDGRLPAWEIVPRKASQPQPHVLRYPP